MPVRRLVLSHCLCLFLPLAASTSLCLAGCISSPTAGIPGKPWIPGIPGKPWIPGAISHREPVVVEGGRAEVGVAIAVDGHAPRNNQALEKRAKMRACISEVWNRAVEEEERESMAKAAATNVRKENALEATKTVSAAKDVLDFSFDDNMKMSTNRKLDLHVLAGRVKASCRVIEHVDQRDVVLMLGNTGVGKSLLIQAVAGRRVRRKRYSIRTESLQEPNSDQALGVSQDANESGKMVWDVDDPVEGFAIGHDQVSKTSCMRHFSPESSTVVYLDAPGYEDTSGSEVDIATSVAFCEVATHCSNLRFVVLIDCNAFKVDRGGVMRGVAKLVSSFADFRKHKCAFTFIFTKSDSLGGAQTAAEARKLVLNVVSETLNGSEGDVKDILHWMQHCFNNQLPYVDIYQPGLSDISQLRDLMETFSRITGQGPSAVQLPTAITSPSTDIQFGMTPKVKAQLKLDLQGLVDEFRRALDDGRIAGAERLFATLQFLHTHINTGFLLEAYDSAMRCLVAFGKNSARTTYTLIEKGMVKSERSSSTARFTVHDGGKVLRGIATLRLLARVQASELQAEEEALNVLDKGLTCMSAMVGDCFKAGADVRPRILTPAELQTAFASQAEAFEALRKLRVWGKVHDVFSLWAHHAEAALEQGLVQAVALALELSASSETPHVTQLLLAIIQLAQLQVCAASVNHVDIPEAMGKCKQRMQKLISKMPIEAAAILSTNGNCEEAGFQRSGEPDVSAYGRCLQSMEDICATLAVPQLNDASLVELREAAGDARLLTLTVAKTHLHNLLDEVGRVPASLDTQAPGTWPLPSLKQLLATIQTISSSLSRAQHLECNTGGLYPEAVSKAGEVMRQLTEHADACFTQALLDQRLAEPEHHAAVLRQLNASTWFDGHLLACGRSPWVRKAVGKLRQQYADLCERANHTALEALWGCFPAGEDAELRHPGCQTSAPRFQAAAGLLEQLHSLEVEVPEIALLVQDFYEQAHAVVNQWCQRGNRSGLGELTYAAVPLRDELAVWIDEALGASAALRLVKRLAPLAEEVSRPLTLQLFSLNASIWELFPAGSGRNASEKKCEAVVALRCWRERGLHRLLAHLPDAKQLEAEIVTQVDKAAAAARNAVSESTGDVVGAESALTELTALAEAFQTLECGRSAGATASDLRQTLDLRITCLEDALQESLEQGRFRYVRDYVEPLLGASDALKREQGDRVLAAARQMLYEKAKAAKSQVANASAVAEIVRVLMDADEHIGEPLTRNHGFDANEEASCLRKLATAHLTDLVKRLASALADLNYGQILGTAAVVREYSDATSSWSSRPTPRSLPGGGTRAPPTPTRDVDSGVKAAESTQRKPAKATPPSWTSVVKSGIYHGTEVVKSGISQAIFGCSGIELPDAKRSWAFESGLQRGTERRGRQASTAHFQDLWKHTQQLLHEVETCLDDVDEQAVSFVKHLKSREFGQVEFDTSKLLRMLSKLQAAVLEGGTAGALNTPLAERYSQVTKKLSSELRQALEQVRRQAETEQLYTTAIEVWSILHRKMAGGFKSHLSLSLDLEGELKRMRELHSKATGKMRANCLTIELLESKVRPLLRDLQSKPCGVSRWFSWHQREYQQQKQIFGDQVLEMLKSTEETALKQKNYPLAGKTAAVLQHVFRSASLTAHLELHTMQPKWSRLREMIVAEYCHTCKQMKTALGKGGLQNFKPLLHRVHEFEVGLFAVFPSELKPEAQGVHKAIHEWVTQQAGALTIHLNEFELADAAESVRLLRCIGKVLLTTFALYFDMAEADNRHSVKDQELCQLYGTCTRHFGFEEMHAIGGYYAVLQLEPTNKTKTDVGKAFHLASRTHHPDKGGSTAMQQRIANARDELLQDSVRKTFEEHVRTLFSKLILNVPADMLRQVRELLKEHEYEQVVKILSQLDNLPKLMELARGAGPEVEQSVKRIQKAVKEHMTSMRVSVSQLWQQRNLKQLSKQLEACDRADTAFSNCEDLYSREWSSEIQKSVETEIDNIAVKARAYMRGKTEDEADAKMPDFALQLIYLGRILDDLPWFKEFCRLKIAGLLDMCHENNWGHRFVFNLGILLGQGRVGDLDKDGKVVAEDDRIGKCIVSDFKHFQDVFTMVWNEEVTQKDVGAIAQTAVAWSVRNQKRETVALDTDALVKGFREYEAVYAQCFGEWVAGRLTLKELAQRATNGASAVQPASSQEWGPQLTSKLPTLVAQVFCFFTIAKSGDSYTRLAEREDKLDVSSSKRDCGTGTSKIDNILLRPHPTQVLTVLQMLGYGGSSGQLLRQLMQIRTGEGKSLILGSCSVVLALLGFSVRCVCYSDYLSQRDYALFAELFDGFGVRDRVAYSTITDYSEDVVKRKGDIRNLTDALFRGELESQLRTRDVTGRNRSSTKSDASRPRLASGSAVLPLQNTKSNTVSTNQKHPREILLVDEVDIFFGKGFYGQTHNQVVRLYEPEASALLQAVWRLRTRGGESEGYRPLLRDVTNSPEYAHLLGRFQKWGAVIEREVQAMCADVFCFNDPKPHYDCGLDRLGYKIMDGIDYGSVVYRYRTAFAHLHAVDTNVFRNPEAALKRALYLQLPCGKFSYANIQPECILGVSGTLPMSAHGLEVMQRYQIQLYSSMPSVYGDTRLKFDHAGDAISIEKSLPDFHRLITDEVNQKTRAGRAVIVVFETPRQLEAYSQSPYFKKVMQANVLHESLDSKKRDHVIRKAATSGQATFSSAVFGRGTDFFCQDRKLSEAGGVHVLQAFFSIQKAEEVQIQGRTARQGKQGTYGLVLLQSDLEESFGLGSDAFENVARSTWYAVLDDARSRVQVAARAEIEEDLAEATRIDTLSHRYFDALKGLPTHRAADCFLELYQELRPEKVHRTGDYHVIFLIDTSGSMDETDVQPRASFAVHGHNNRLGCALEACDAFVRKRSAAGAADVITLVRFDRVASTVVQAMPLQDNMITDILERGWKGAQDGTNFEPAFESAATAVLQDVSGLPVLIMFLTDGQNNGDWERLKEALRPLHENEEVLLKAIGFGSDSSVEGLQFVAEPFGARGQYSLVPDEVELVESFEAAAGELSHTGKRGLSRT